MIDRYFPARMHVHIFPGEVGAMIFDTFREIPSSASSLTGRQQIRGRSRFFMQRRGLVEKYFCGPTSGNRSTEPAPPGRTILFRPPDMETEPAKRLPCHAQSHNNLTTARHVDERKPLPVADQRRSFFHRTHAAIIRNLTPECSGHRLPPIPIDLFPSPDG